MASTYSSILKIELIATSEQNGLWGSTTNANLGTAIEEAITGKATATFSSDANLTISIANSTSTQTARNLAINVTSDVSLTATRSLIVPNGPKQYFIWNNTTGNQSILVKTSAGSGVTVANGAKALVYADGANVVVPVNYYLQPTLVGSREVKSAVSGSTIDLSLGNYFTKTITTNTTLALSNVPAAGTVANFILDITNGGNFTVTWWSGVKWSNGNAPILTSDGTDSLGFYTHDGGTTWYSFLLGEDLK